MTETMAAAMTGATPLILAWIAGLGLGSLFFGGLWWTLRKALASARPAVWIGCSLLLRLGLVVPGIYFVSAGHWQRLLLCLLGLIMSRIGVIWLTRSADDRNRLEQVSRNAS